MPTRHRSRRGFSGNRRRTTWATVAQTASIPAANGFTVLDLLQQYKAVVGAADPGITIARTHLRLVPTAGFTAVGNNLAVGLIIVNENQVGTNVAGSPRPASDTELDWMYWDWMYQDSETSGITELDSGQLRVDIRSKRAMRQVGETYGLAIQVPASAAFPAVIQVTGRILLMLP